MKGGWPCPKGYYIYAHIRPDTGEVFYVGKGIYGRAWDWSPTGRNQDWHAAAQSHWFSVRIEEDGLDAETAVIREMIWIQRHLSRGAPLTNRAVPWRCREPLAEAYVEHPPPRPPRKLAGRLSERDKVRMVTRYWAGERPTALAKEYGVTPRTVYREIAKRGTPQAFQSAAPRPEKCDTPS